MDKLLSITAIALSLYALNQPKDDAELRSMIYGAIRTAKDAKTQADDAESQASSAEQTAENVKQTAENAETLARRATYDVEDLRKSIH